MKSMVKFAPSSTKLGSSKSERCLCPYPSRKEVGEDKPWKWIFSGYYFLICCCSVCAAAFSTVEWLLAEDELFSWTVFL